LGRSGSGRDPILEGDWAYSYLGHDLFARYKYKMEKILINFNLIDANVWVKDIYLYELSIFIGFSNSNDATKYKSVVFFIISYSLT
jgi:hypothetical protein